MPRGEVHQKIEYFLTGRSRPDIHNIIDGPIGEMGFLHRLIGHSPLMVLRCKPENRKHVFIHQMCDLCLIPFEPWLGDKGKWGKHLRDTPKTPRRFMKMHKRWRQWMKKQDI